MYGAAPTSLAIKNLQRAEIKRKRDEPEPKPMFQKTQQQPCLPPKIGPSSFWASSIYKPCPETLISGKPMDECIMHWPEKTDIYCWLCVHPFEGVPVPIPVNVNNVIESFTPFGVFCSFECAKRYILEHPSSSSQNDMKNLSVMAKNLFHYPTMEIHPAPPPISLRIFGGYMTIEEFRAKSGKVEVLAHTPPFVSTIMIFEEKDIYHVKLSDQVDASSSKVILSIPKPTKQMFSIRGIRQPKEDREAPSNRDSRVHQKAPAYSKFLEKMRTMSQIIPPAVVIEEEEVQIPEKKKKKSRKE
jgi:hypothetical protein